MDEISQSQQSVQNKYPNELLIAQTQSLTELVHIQKLQSNQIGELQQQNKRLIELLENVSDEAPGTGNVYVKIEDVNMPFGALVGLMLKIAFASIPAAIILGVLYFGVITLITTLLVNGIF